MGDVAFVNMLDEVEEIVDRLENIVDEINVSKENNPTGRLQLLKFGYLTTRSEIMNFDDFLV